VQEEECYSERCRRRNVTLERCRRRIVTLRGAGGGKLVTIERNVSVLGM